jgi:GT2 family glycosyltransferase
MLLTASIVIYNNTENDLKQVITSTVNSIIEKIYIIDNSDNDNLKEYITNISGKMVYFQGHGNVGYGAGHNIALHEAIKDNSDFHVILNPDISFAPDIISTLLSYMQNNDDVSYILPKVTYPNGEIQYLCKLLPTPFDLIFRRFTPNTKLKQNIVEKYELRASGYDKIINPPCLSGCFMFLRLETLVKYNIFFDERFFMYCEDFDLMRRIHKVAKTIFYPEVTIIHDHAKQSYKSKRMLLEHIKSAIKYFNKWGWFFDKERKEMNNKILNEIKALNNPQQT